jgi:hypothetical protein
MGSDDFSTALSSSQGDHGNHGGKQLETLAVLNVSALPTTPSYNKAISYLDPPSLSDHARVCSHTLLFVIPNLFYSRRKISLTKLAAGALEGFATVRSVVDSVRGALNCPLTFLCCFLCLLFCFFGRFALCRMISMMSKHNIELALLTSCHPHTGLKLSKKPTSSKRLGYSHNPGGMVKTVRTNRINRKIAMAKNAATNPSMPMLKYQTPILSFNGHNG